MQNWALSETLTNYNLHLVKNPLVDLYLHLSLRSITLVLATLIVYVEFKILHILKNYFIVLYGEYNKMTLEQSDEKRGNKLQLASTKETELIHQVSKYR